MQSFSNSKLSNFSPVMVTGRRGGGGGCGLVRKARMRYVFPDLARTAATEVGAWMDSYQPLDEIWNTPHWVDWKPGSQYPVHIWPPAVPLSVGRELREAPPEAPAPQAGADLYRVLLR